MEQTPKALRKHVVLRGETNAGKSTLFNALAQQQAAIVSPTPGTTTDPVSLAMELIPFGPIVLVDTAGTGDSTVLGAQREAKTAMVSRRADAGLYVADAGAFPTEAYNRFLKEKIPHLLLLAQIDQANGDDLAMLWRKYPEALLFSPEDEAGIVKIRQELSRLLSGADGTEKSLMGGLVQPGSNLILVTPIDSAAPKGRLILPQVQVLRDCLDHGIKCLVCRETELESALTAMRPVDLVVTDSQAFGYVNQRLPREIPLTSFSMLFARQKGNFAQLVAGAKALENLPDNSRILMLEGCTHNKTHEDIGRVKIPAMLAKKTGKTFRFEPYSGYDFPSDLSGYSLAIQCGGCMLNKAEIARRLESMEEAGLPVTNYGVCLAWGSGILDRCCEIFEKEPTG